MIGQDLSVMHSQIVARFRVISVSVLTADATTICASLVER